MRKPTDVKRGEVYQHYKGATYIVTDICLDSDTNQAAWRVSYRRAIRKGAAWVEDLSQDLTYNRSMAGFRDTLPSGQRRFALLPPEGTIRSATPHP